MFHVKENSCVNFTYEGIEYKCYILNILHSGDGLLLSEFSDALKFHTIGFDGKNFTKKDKIIDNVKFWKVNRKDIFDFVNLPLPIQFEICTYFDDNTFFNLSKTNKFYHSLYYDRLPHEYKIKYGDVSDMIYRERNYYFLPVIRSFRPLTMSQAEFYHEANKYFVCWQEVNMQDFNLTSTRTDYIAKYIEENKIVSLRLICSYCNPITSYINVIALLEPLYIAACRGHLETLQFIEKQLPGFVSFAIEYRAKRIIQMGHLDIMKWLYNVSGLIVENYEKHEN